MVEHLVKKELLISLLIHIIIIAYISHQYINTPLQIINKNKKEPIKSFLYAHPKSTQLSNVTNIVHKVLQNTNTLIYQNKKLTLPTTKNKINKKEAVNVKLPVKINAIPKKNITSNTAIKKTIINHIKTQSFIKELYKQDTFESINPKFNSTVNSVFNPTPIIVPKSKTILPKEIEQKRKQRIAQHGNGISIQKDEQGHCTVTQDLSLVGMEGLTSTQRYKCGGKTTFEKNFTQHMKEAMKYHK